MRVNSDISVKIYNVAVFILCIVSVMFAMRDYAHGLTAAETYIDRFIYALFVIDYVVRLFMAKDKKAFFKTNIFDLIAIIPAGSAFRAFRLARFVKLLKLTKLFRVGSASARLLSKASRFFDTNGFKYMVMISVVCIFIATIAMMRFEGMSFPDALWWSFVTATTVGYGDLAPASMAGRITASLLMIVGIGLIGSLTSTITSFFLKSEPETCSSDKVDMVKAMYDTLSDQEQNEFRNMITK